jgi:hypothetical protein
VRADAAAIGGKADHQVVEARIGQEAELAQQRVGLGVEQVDALYQQGPFLLFQRRQAFSGPCCMFQWPSMADQARFDVVGWPARPARRNRTGLEAGDGVADQEGFLCQ